jgi:hypothetical protein
MTDAQSIEAALAFVARLNAGELPDLSGLWVDVDEAVVDGCVVVLFGVLRPASSPDRSPDLAPVACRLRLHEDAVTDWRLYGVGEPHPSLFGVAASA